MGYFCFSSWLARLPSYFNFGRTLHSERSITHLPSISSLSSKSKIPLTSCLICNEVLESFASTHKTNSVQRSHCFLFLWTMRMLLESWYRLSFYLMRYIAFQSIKIDKFVTELFSEILYYSVENCFHVLYIYKHSHNERPTKSRKILTFKLYTYSQVLLFDNDSTHLRLTLVRR